MAVTIRRQRRLAHKKALAITKATYIYHDVICLPTASWFPINTDVCDSSLTKSVPKQSNCRSKLTWIEGGVIKRPLAADGSSSAPQLPVSIFGRYAIPALPTISH